MLEQKRLRVLVVDDSVVYRKIISDVLSQLPHVEVVGTASNGKIAMTKIASLKPDILTLDIEMPEMNGLDVLAAMQKNAPDIGTIVLSNLTRKGGDLTIQALELGAFDFITKPEADSMAKSREEIKSELAAKLQAFSRQLEIRRILNNAPASATKRKKKIDMDHYNAVQRIKPANGKRKKSVEIVGIGVSTGGPKALIEIMPKIPSDINVPILIVQHMPPFFTQSLAKNLDSKCEIDVREAVDGEAIYPNSALIAPGGKQMKIVQSSDGINRMIRITDDPPENSCRPSVDYLFRSIAYQYTGRSAGVILTGMGSDGSLGVKLMKRYGSLIIAQNKASCVVYGMPKEPIESGIVDVIAPISKIAEEILSAIKSTE